MIQKSRIWRDFEALPLSAQQQVADYIAVLRARSVEAAAGRASGRTPLREEPFVGLWTDRDDLSDSTAWVRRLRESEWQGQ